MDETLAEHEEVWAAAGTPEAVFPVAPDRLRDCRRCRGVTEGVDSHLFERAPPRSRR